MSRLDGFVMERCTGNIRTTERSRLFMTVTAGDNGDVIMFQSETVRVLNHAPYVHLFYNYNNRCIAIHPCERDDDAIRFHRESSYSKTRIRWSRKSIADVLRGFLNPVSTSLGNHSGSDGTVVDTRRTEDGRKTVEDSGILPTESFTVDGTYYSNENVVIFDLKNARALKRKPAV